MMMDSADFSSNLVPGEKMDGKMVNLFDPRIPDILKPEDVFTIQVGDSMFRLSGASISSDAPSYFTEFFKPYRDEPEEKRPVLYIDRSADVFNYICRHLQGYHVVPEDESMYVYLFADASYYSLPRLQQLLKTSEILVRIGCQRFRLARDLFNSPGDTPNFFTLGFAAFFGSLHDETFHKRLIRPLPLWPAEVPGRSPELFQHLVNLFQGIEDFSILNRGLRNSLIKECRYYRFRGLEQKLIPHEIQVNQERGGVEEITILFNVIKPTGVSIGTLPTGFRTVMYQRPHVDEYPRDLIIQIEDEEAFISSDSAEHWSGSIVGLAGDKMKAIINSKALASEFSTFSPDSFCIDIELADLTINGQENITDLTKFFDNLTSGKGEERKRKAGSESNRVYFCRSQWRFVFGDFGNIKLQLLLGIGHTDGLGRNKVRKLL